MVKFLIMFCFLLYRSAFSSDDIDFENPERDSRCVKTPIQGDDDFVRGVTGSYVNGQPAKDLIKRTSTDDYSVSASSTVEDSIKGLIVQIDKLQDRKAQIIRRLQRSERTVGQQENLIREKDQEISKLNSSVSRLTAEKQALEEKLKTTNDRVKSLQDSVSGGDGTIQKLRETTTKQENLIREKDQEISKLNSSVSRLTAEKQALEEKLKLLSSEVDSMKKNTKDLEDEKIILVHTRDELLSENERLKGELTTKLDELKGANARETKVQLDALKKMMAEQQAATKELHRVELKYTTLETRVHGLISTCYGLQKIDVKRGEDLSVNERISLFLGDTQESTEAKDQTILKQGINLALQYQRDHVSDTKFSATKSSSFLSLLGADTEESLLFSKKPKSRFKPKHSKTFSSGEEREDEEEQSEGELNDHRRKKSSKKPNDDEDD